MIFKKACQLYAVGFCFAQTYLLLFPMFMMAWASGTYECILQINLLGEADVEMIFWAVSFPFIIYGIYHTLYDVVKK